MQNPPQGPPTTTVPAGPKITEAGPKITETGPKITEAGPKTTEASPKITETCPSVVVKEEKQPSVDPPTLPLFTVQQPPPQSPPTANLIPGPMLYKNRLLQYTQRSGLPLPLYQTINEGADHAPRFRSTVFVDGVSYTSPNTYSHLKSAEQDVSQFALDSVIKKMKEQGYSILNEDPVFCKSILHEFGAKMNMGMPIYSTRKSGVIPAFVSSLVFNSVTYAGEPAKSKKEAEQLGARAVILTLLGNPEFETVLWDVIKSKFKFYDALHKAEDASNKQNSLSSVEVQDENSNKISPCNEMQVPVVVSQHPSPISVSSLSSQQMDQSSLRNTMVPELANTGVNVPFQGSHPQNEIVPSGFQQSTVCSATNKKRLRRQRHKANKRARAGAKLGDASMAPGNQTQFLFRDSVLVPQLGAAIKSEF